MIYTKFKEKIMWNTPIIPESKIKTLCLKWNRTISGYVAVLIFCVIIFLVVYSAIITSDTDQIKNGTNVESTRIQQYYLKSFDRDLDKPHCTGTETCKISCNYLNQYFNEEVIKSGVEEHCQAEKVNFLEIINATFPDYSITHQWLHSLTKDVRQLQFITCGVKELKENAFAGKPFEALTRLTIVGSFIQYLPKNAFKNMSMLSMFAMRIDVDIDNLKDFKVEENVFEGMPNLEVLQIENCLRDPVTIQNMTGENASKLSKLQRIHFAPNPLLQALNRMSFVNAKDLRALIINPNLTRIDTEAFWPVQIQRIDIAENRLELIHEGIFNHTLINADFNGSIFIGGNPWECNCSLQWLKDYYLSNISLINLTNPPLCNGRPFKDVNFCQSTTSEITLSTQSTELTHSETESSTNALSSTQPSEITFSESDTSTQIMTELTSTTNEITLPQSTTLTTVTESTSSLSSTHTTESNTGIEEPGDEEIKITCRDVTRYPIIVPPSVPREYMGNAILSIRNQTLYLEFYDLDYDDVYVEINITGDIEQYRLYWFSTIDVFENGCISKMKNTVILNKLERSTMYSMCFIYANEKTVPPYACFGVKVLEEYDSRTWITNEQKTLVICSIFFTVLGIIVICAVSVFYCIRQHPNLIRGNKRVIIVESKTADAIVMPKTYVKPERNHSGPGYLTPCNPIYDYIPSGGVRRQRRMSIQSVTSYIKATPVSRQDLNSWRNEYVGQSSTLDNIATIAQDLPPPVPPFHPSERIRNIDLGHSSYSEI